MQTSSEARSVRTVAETARAVRTGQSSAMRAVRDAIVAIERLNPALNSFAYIDAAGALATAAATDEMVASDKDPGPLAGVPFGVKDLDDCIGMPTSLGSLIFKGSRIADREPPLVARLRSAGAIPIGKTTTPEFGDSAATYSRAWGVTRNPWRLDRTPGGSSGGSAAAVASGAVPFATGSDMGGSIRCPASFCGLVGLKPSHGLIPGDGRVGPGQFAVDLHCWGVLTTTVLDTALLLNVAAGPCAADRASLAHRPQDYLAAAEQLDVRGLRVAWSPDLGYAIVDPTVVSVTEAAANRLIESAGLVRRRVSIDFSHLLLTSAVYRDLRALLEVEGLLPNHADDLGDEVRSDISRWSEMSFGQQGLVMKTRAELQRTVSRLFEDVDVIMTPSTACVAFGAEEPNASVIDGRAATEFGAEAFTSFANACWLPAISVPAGTANDDLPIGLQIVAPFGRDDLTLRLARLLEVEQPWVRTTQVGVPG